MAITLAKVKYYSIGKMVADRLNSFVVQKKQIRDMREADFLRRVTNDGWNYGQQIQYRKSQLDAEKNKENPDNDYISELKTNLSSLGKLKKAEDFRVAYNNSLDQLKTNQKNYQEHLDWLNDQLNTNPDTELADTIRTDISTAKQEMFNLQEIAITNRATLALSDKTLPLLNKSIDEVNNKRAEALAVGNESAVAKWDANLFNLKSQKESTKIEDAYNDLSINSMKNPTKSVDMLNFYKNNLGSALGENVPVNVNGIRYNTAKDFWQSGLNTFVQNTFFNTYSQEISDKLDTAEKTLTPLLELELNNINSEIDNLQKISELAPFADKFNQLKTSVNFTAVDKIGVKVLDDYNNGRLGKTTMDNFNNARTKLDSLNKKYNVDVSSYLNKITEDMATKKAQVAQNIIQVAGSKNISVEEAAKQVPDITMPETKVAEAKPVEIAKQTKESMVNKQTPYSISGEAKPIGQEVKTQIPVTPQPQPYQLKNKNISSANPMAVANSSFINALYQEGFGRNATTNELKKFTTYKVKDASNLILGQNRSPFSNPAQIK